MAASSPIRLTVGGAEYIKPMARLLSAAFMDDPVGRYMYLTDDNLPNDAVIPREKIEAGFIDRLTKRFVVGPDLVEAGNWAAAALWFPPHAKIPAPDPANAPEALVEFYNRFAVIKKQYLGERNYWYLNLLGRDPSRSDPGVVSALVTSYLKKARDDGVPAWIEASGTRSRDIYIHLGFRLVETVRVAVGKADENGYRVEGGEGIPMYGLIYEPEL